MKVKNLSSLAVLAGTALIAGSADAGLISMDLVLLDTSGGWDTYQLVGTFDGGTDRVDSIVGTVTNPFEISLSSGIVNVNDGQAGGYNADRPWGGSGPRDTWITLGQTTLGFGFAGVWSPDPFGVTGAENPVNSIQLFTDGLTNLFSTNVALFQTGGIVVSSTDNFGGDPAKMVFFQLTVANGTTGFISGAISGLTNGELALAFTDGFSAALIPAPGALALLGIAGLIGRPRRRRA